MDPGTSNNGNVGGEHGRNSYRKYLRPNYKPSMVSLQTDKNWRRRTTERLTQEEFHADNADSTDESHPMSIDGDSSPGRLMSEYEPTSPESSISEHDLNSLARSSGNEIRTLSEDNESSHDDPDGSFASEGSSFERAGFEDEEQNNWSDSSEYGDNRKQYPWENRIFFEKSDLTVRDVLAMIRGISLRFGLTLEARLALVNYTKLLAGPEFETLNLSNYVISRMFDPPDDQITFCFYCPDCKAVLESRNKTKAPNPEGLCHRCGSKCNLSTKKNGKYFLIVDMKYQIERLFRHPDVKTALLSFYRREGQNNDIRNNIRDVQDGLLYQKVNSRNSHTVLTFQFFLDGAALRRSSTEGFWSILFYINDLPLSIRFKYIMLGGLMLTHTEPNPALMNALLGKFNEQVEVLSTEGIKLKIGNISIQFSFRPLCLIADSVARPILQNRLQHSGYDSCSWCYQHGFYSQRIRFPFDANFVYRSHASHLQDVNEARLRQANLNNPRDLRETFVRGVKGWSALLELQYLNFDIVWSLPLEYMHCILLGILPQMWDAWIKMRILNKNDVAAINYRLSEVKPILENHRLPRKLDSKAKWKASEWKSWLLFFGIPCLRDYLPSVYLEHFSLLVNSTFTLLKSTIAKNELLRCECDLVQFVGQFEILYSVERMTFNVHTLLHLVESVRQCGPLWANSAFPFESHLFVLKQYATGPKNPEQQMAKKSLAILEYKFVVDTSIFHSESAKQYCETIFSHKVLTTYVTRTPYGVTFCGKSEAVEINNPENNVRITGKSFKKCIYKSCVYKSTEYTLSPTRNDTVVKLKSGQVRQIKNIIQTDVTCYLSTTQLIVVPDALVRHMAKVERTDDDETIIPINEVAEKLIFIELETCSYVCHLPQSIEVQ